MIERKDSINLPNSDEASKLDRNKIPDTQYPLTENQMVIQIKDNYLKKIFFSIFLFSYSRIDKYSILKQLFFRHLLKIIRIFLMVKGNFYLILAKLRMLFLINILNVFVLFLKNVKTKEVSKKFRLKIPGTNFKLRLMG